MLYYNVQEYLFYYLFKNNVTTFKLCLLIIPSFVFRIPENVWYYYEMLFYLR